MWILQACCTTRSTGGASGPRPPTASPTELSTGTEPFTPLKEHFQKFQKKKLENIPFHEAFLKEICEIIRQNRQKLCCCNTSGQSSSILLKMLNPVLWSFQDDVPLNNMKTDYSGSTVYKHATLVTCFNPHTNGRTTP
jgi:hypothetical protein